MLINDQINRLEKEIELLPQDHPQLPLLQDCLGVLRRAEKMTDMVTEELRLLLNGENKKPKGSKSFAKAWEKLFLAGTTRPPFEFSNREDEMLVLCDRQGKAWKMTIHARCPEDAAQIEDYLYWAESMWKRHVSKDIGSDTRMMDIIIASRVWLLRSGLITQPEFSWLDRVSAAVGASECARLQTYKVQADEIDKLKKKLETFKIFSTKWLQDDT